MANTLIFTKKKIKTKQNQKNTGGTTDISERSVLIKCFNNPITWPWDDRADWNTVIMY